MNQSIKDALRRIVETLPHLKAEGDGAIPTAQRADVAAIRKSAKNSGQRDPQIEAAEEWAIALLEKALGEDAPAPPEQPDAPSPTGGNAELGVPTNAAIPIATVEHGGVALHEKPLGELTEAELDTLTAPKEGE